MRQRIKTGQIKNKLAGSTIQKKLSILLLPKVTKPGPSPSGSQLIDPVGFPTLGHALAAIIAK